MWTFFRTFVSGWWLVGDLEGRRLLVGINDMREPEIGMHKFPTNKVQPFWTTNWSQLINQGRQTCLHFFLLRNKNMENLKYCNALEWARHAIDFQWRTDKSIKWRSVLSCCVRTSQATNALWKLATWLTRDGKRRHLCYIEDLSIAMYQTYCALRQL